MSPTSSMVGSCFAMSSFVVGMMMSCAPLPGSVNCTRRRLVASRLAVVPGPRVRYGRLLPHRGKVHAVGVQRAHRQSRRVRVALATNEANPGSFSASGRYAPTILLSDISPARAARFGARFPPRARSTSALVGTSPAHIVRDGFRRARGRPDGDGNARARPPSIGRAQARAGDARAVVPIWVETANIVSGVVSRRR